jgi:hypothetical protein
MVICSHQNERDIRVGNTAYYPIMASSSLASCTGEIGGAD